MTYTKQLWVDNNVAYPVSAARMNHMEAGISSAAEATVNVKDFGAKGDGATDDTAAVNAAIASLSTVNPHGGIVVFPSPANNYVCLGTVNLNGLTNVTLQGGGGLDGFTIGGAPGGATQILFGGESPGVERGIDMRNAYGCTIADLQIYSYKEKFSGNLVDMEGGRGNNAWRSTFGVGGIAPFGSPVCLFTGGGAQFNSFYACRFIGGQYGVVGRLNPAHEPNAHNFYGCQFIANHSKHILNAGKGWSLYGCTFEQLRNNKGEEGAGVGCYAQQPGYTTEGLAFFGCWIGDGPIRKGHQIEFKGNGLTLVGCEIAVGETMVNLIEGASSDIVMLGNKIEACTSALNIFSGSSRVLYMGNHIGPNSLTGTEVVGKANASGSFIQTGAGSAWKKFNAALGASPTTEEIRLLTNQLREALISVGAGE